LSTKVLIGIQARSGSSRLPKKAFELIGEKRMLDHVIDACRSAAHYMATRRTALAPDVTVALLVPVGDKIGQEFGRGVEVVEGSEHDVLSRYHLALQRYTPDFVVRITGDCPLIPDFLIGKHVTTAIKGRYDYLSNVDEDSRTAMDGHDCEVLSSRLLAYVHGAAESEYDREHVTPLARREPPEWARNGFVINYHDQSALKLSVDTAEDLERVREEYRRRDLKLYRAERKFGRQSVHRL
jgi:spore coat polysaccharide biosynthesis protein SpsF (cytidylyltransferase family)